MSSKTLSKETKKMDSISSASLSSFSSGLPASFTDGIGSSVVRNKSFASLVKTPIHTQQQKQKHHSNKMISLASLLRYMEGYELIVELKTGKRHRGILTNADDTMNMTLKQVEQRSGDSWGASEASLSMATTTTAKTTISSQHPNQQQESCQSELADRSWTSIDGLLPVALGSANNEVTIRGSQVRFVQFPDNANLSSIVLSGREREQHARNKYRKTVRKASS
ncbi:LSM domain containing protein [Nitzschia inconspicua]|uniref:LSM domain containing protein n=1 Tax=Nitzschia inconspicua TaxID=303405 RepID=A0A9K3M0A4_9STRA|nr:LSM domain containing protein [Nitzschia inconspicua]